MKVSVGPPPAVFLSSSPLPKKKVAKDTVIIKSTRGSFTHEAVMKKNDPLFNPGESAVPVHLKSSSTVVVLNPDDMNAPPKVTTLERAWRDELIQRGSLTLWNVLQCDLDSAEKAADTKAPCSIGMKTAIIDVPSEEEDKDEEAVRHLVTSGWTPKKMTRWTSAWSVKDGVFMPVGGMWLLSTKSMQLPCELA